MLNARLQNEIIERERVSQEVSDMAVNLQKKNQELSLVTRYSPPSRQEPRLIFWLL